MDPDFTALTIADTQYFEAELATAARDFVRNEAEHGAKDVRTGSARGHLLMRAIQYGDAFRNFTGLRKRGQAREREE